MTRYSTLLMFYRPEFALNEITLHFFFTLNFSLMNVREEKHCAIHTTADCDWEVVAPGMGTSGL